LEGIKKSIAILALISCAVFLLSACAGATSIAGKWKSDAQDTTEVEFMSDGTLDTYSGGKVVYSASYRTEGNKLIVNDDGEEQTGTFKIEGNKLILIGPNNETDVFYRE